MGILTHLQQKFAPLWQLLDERARRLTAANEARALGRGGVSLVSHACGLSRKAITKGMREIEEGTPLAPGRIRRPGAGRKKIVARDPGLLGALERLIDPATRGDPESPLRWVCKSTRAVAAQLTRQKHPLSYVKVAQILKEQGCSLQSNRKTEEGEDHPDRDAPFRHINTQVKRALARKTPVISVDTKKKELLGNFDNNGQQWLPAKKPLMVNGHDFPAPDVPRAYPYGVYDLERNTGFVTVGTNHDTGAFAVASIRGWWRAEGGKLYPGGRGVCSSRPTAAAATVGGCGSGNWNCRSSLTKQAWPFPSVIFRRERASGTRSNTGSSPSSPRTGAGSRCATTRRSCG